MIDNLPNLQHTQYDDRMPKNLSLLIICVIVLSTHSTATDAQSEAAKISPKNEAFINHKPRGESAQHAALRRDVYMLLALEKLPESGGELGIKFERDQNGLIKNPKIDRWSGDLQTEVACLEALYQAGMRKPLSSNDVFLHLFEGNRFISSDNSLLEFRRINPELRGDALVHLVPLSFAGIFKTKELRSVSNLASLGTEKEVVLMKLGKIYEDWAPFLSAPNSFSHDQIVNQAKIIKTKYRLREGEIPPGGNTAN